MRAECRLLRLHGSVHFLADQHQCYGPATPRIALPQIGGARIQRGDLVIVSIAAANRDPAVFAEPDRFDLRRRNARQNFGFARGPHFCPGAELARLEARSAIRALLRLPDVRLDAARPSAPRGLVFRKPPALHACWSP